MGEFMKQTIIALFLGIFAFSSALAGTTIKNLDEKIPIDKNVKTGVFENGLRYYIKKNAKPEDNAHFRLVIRAGAINEDDDQNGLAHFTEHMCFNGTKHFPKNELIDFLQKTGVQFGADVNAGTGLDQTMYELPISIEDPKMIDNALLVLEDWAHNVTFDGDQIDDERGVIVSEWRQRNNYQFRLGEKRADKLYYNSKYAKRNLIGDTNLLWHFKYDVIRRFYKDWYRPDLQAIIAVGDFDVEEVYGKIKEHFASIPKRDNPRKWEKVHIADHKQTLADIATDKEIPIDLSLMYFKLPEYDLSTYRGYRENIVRSLYDNMFNQRIQEISNKPNPPFIQAGGGESNFNGDKRSYVLYAVGQAGKGLDAASALLDAAFRVKQHGFTATELERAKESYLSNLKNVQKQKNTLTHSAFVNEYTQNFLSSESIPGIDLEVELADNFLQNITLDEVNELADLYLTKENTVLTLGMPDKADLTKPSEDDFLALFNAKFDKQYEPYIDETNSDPLFTEDITPGKIVSEKMNKDLELFEYTLSNGAKLILKPTDFKENEILFSAVSQGGTSLVSDNDYFSAEQASEIITTCGLGEFSQTELQKKLSGKQVAVSPFINELSEGMRGQSSVEDLETMLQLIHMYFTSPRKDNDAYTSLIQKYKSYLMNASQSPDQAFADTIQVTMASHHYREQPASVKLLDKVDLDAAYRIFDERFEDASDFTFIFVGSFDLGKMKDLAAKYIGSLPNNKTNEKWKDVGIEKPEKSITKIIKAGEEDKAHVRLMIPGEFAWGQKERQRLQSMIDYFDIKFTEVIREKMSGVYSPGIWVATEKYPESEYTINIDFVTDPERIDELVSAIMDLINEVKNTQDPVTAMKVQKAQRTQRNRNLKQNGYWIGSLAAYIERQDDINTIPDWDNHINSLSAEDIQKTAQKYFNTDKMIKVILEPTTM